MIGTGCCFKNKNSGVEIRGRESDYEPLKADFFRGRVCEDERRQSLLDYLERLRCEPLGELDSEDDCESSIQRNPAAKMRHSKMKVRRSSALVKNGRTSDENLCFRSNSGYPEFPSCHSRINVVEDYGGSILHGETRGAETQTSRSHSRSSFFAVSSTKGSRNWTRTEKKRKFPPLAKISNVSGDRLSRYLLPCNNKCSCSNTGLNKHSRNALQIRFHPENSSPISNDHVITTASTSDEEFIDYQVPIERSFSSHERYETLSESRTLVPTSSHVTIRICSANSISSINCDQCNDQEHDSHRSSGSENSINHLEERVRRGLRAMCCCEHRVEEDTLQKEPASRCSRSECKRSSKPKCFSSKECQTSLSRRNIRGLARTRYFNSRSGTRPRCYKCRNKLVPMTDSIENSEDGSFERFKDILIETRPRKGHEETSRFCFGPNKSVTNSERPICRPVNKKIEVKRPQRVVKKNLPNIQNEIPTDSNCFDPPIILSATEFEKFRDKCERVRNSIKNMMREESIPGCERASKKTSLWEGHGLTLKDFCPDLPPLNHWSQYENGMRKVAEEYKTLKSCVDLIESEAEKPVPSCCCTEKSVTRTYPSGTEFTFKVKRIPETEACQTSSRALFPELRESCDCSGPQEDEFPENCCVKNSRSTHRNEKFLGKGRSVCFEKSNAEKQTCCDYSEEVDSRRNSLTNIEASCAAMKAREADLVKTLETFCEKMKTMKSEFDKERTASVGRSKNMSRRRGRKKIGCGKMKAKKLLIFPPEGENGPPLTLYKNSSNVNCRIKGNAEKGFQYNVTYVQRFVSSTWKPDEENYQYCMDSG